MLYNYHHGIQTWSGLLSDLSPPDRTMPCVRCPCRMPPNCSRAATMYNAACCTADADWARVEGNNDLKDTSISDMKTKIGPVIREHLILNNSESAGGKSRLLNMLVETHIGHGCIQQLHISQASSTLFLFLKGNQKNDSNLAKLRSLLKICANYDSSDNVSTILCLFQMLILLSACANRPNTGTIINPFVNPYLHWMNLEEAEQIGGIFVCPMNVDGSAYDPQVFSSIKSLVPHNPPPFSCNSSYLLWIFFYERKRIVLHPHIHTPACTERSCPSCGGHRCSTIQFLS